VVIQVVIGELSANLRAFAPSRLRAFALKNRFDCRYKGDRREAGRKPEGKKPGHRAHREHSPD
jgi:hypothetical protein